MNICYIIGIFMNVLKNTTHPSITSVADVTDLHTQLFIFKTFIFVEYLLWELRTCHTLRTSW